MADRVWQRVRGLRKRAKPKRSKRALWSMSSPSFLAARAGTSCPDHFLPLHSHPSICRASHLFSKVLQTATSRASHKTTTPRSRSPLVFVGSRNCRLGSLSGLPTNMSVFWGLQELPSGQELFDELTQRRTEEKTGAVCLHVCMSLYDRLSVCLYG